MAATVKQRVIRGARGVGLLAALERVRFATKVASARSRNRTFSRAHPEAMPPAWLTYDAFGDVDYERYWREGEAIADYIEGLIAQGTTPATVCEWGCGPARTLRHLRGRPTVEHVIGSDYNVRTIDWCRASLPDATWILNDLSPPLDLPDASVDFVFAVSVITHLSEENGVEWLEELRRIARPGGLIMLTNHGDHYYDTMLLPHERRQYEEHGFVGRANVLEGSRAYVAFHSPAFMRSTMAVGLELVHHDVAAPVAVAGRQDVWLFRKPPAAP